MSLLVLVANLGDIYLQCIMCVSNIRCRKYMGFNGHGKVHGCKIIYIMAYDFW